MPTIPVAVSRTFFYEDVAVGEFICGECIGHALRGEIMMVTAWRDAGVRHPEPDEFSDWENH